MGFSLEDLKRKVKETAERLIGNGHIEQSGVLTVHLSKIQEVIGDLREAFSDGLQLEDLGPMGKALVALMVMIDDMDELSGEEKKAFIEDAAVVIYKTFDPNFPYLWGKLEDIVERKLVRIFAGMTVEGAVWLIHKFKKAEEDKIEATTEASDEEAPS